MEYRIKMNHIGGYELLRDGTQTETVTNEMQIKETLDEWEVEYPEDLFERGITIPEIVEEIKKPWADRWDDGGGRGWIEVEKINGINCEALKKGYGFTIGSDGKFYALIAGDTGYEDTGIQISVKEAKYIVANLQTFIEENEE